jgi:putative N6-adenine-specific DNA methylase
MSERYFAPCPRGLEAVLASELARLDAKDVAAADGGVAFVGGLALACRVNLESRIASRVLWRVGNGAYASARDVHAVAREIDWPRHFIAERTLRVDVTATRSPLESLEYATLTIKDAIVDRFRDARGVRPSIDKRTPDVRVFAHLTDREATFYLDTSGEPLFKRGYRRDAEEAPLKENLAAGLIALSGWTPEAPFLDPMCGSGTIACEAALIAAECAPGLSRPFAFQKLAWFEGPPWQRMKQAARDHIRAPAGKASIFASDIAQGAVEKTRAHLARAGVADYVELARADVTTRAAPAPRGVLLMNPPYGVRLADEKALAALYPALGDALKKRFAGWTAHIFTADLRAAKLIGLKPARRTPLYNGALECRLFVFPLVEGPMRDRPARPVVHSR